MKVSTDCRKLAAEIKAKGLQHGFQQVGITHTDLSHLAAYFSQWLDKGYHGNMDYLAKYGLQRLDANLVLPGAKRVIVLRMDYLPPDQQALIELRDKTKAYVSLYARGRDYHKVLRKRLNTLIQHLQQLAPQASFRATVDSAPIMEKPLAERAGLGWIGKHTLLINSKAGSWFFLGCIVTDLELPIDPPAERHCGSCRACIDICPTLAIVEEGVLDASKCISYLTIENKGAIPKQFRAAMGNRVFGCDDCQIICPWNKFAQSSQEQDFHPRAQFSSQHLIDYFLWDEKQFDLNTQGSPVRRAGYDGWLRNIAVGLGNAPYSPEILSCLQARSGKVSAMVQDHIDWAIAAQQKKSTLKIVLQNEVGTDAQKEISTALVRG